MGGGRIPQWWWWLWFWCAVSVLSGVGTLPSNVRRDGESANVLSVGSETDSGKVTPVRSDSGKVTPVSSDAESVEVTPVRRENEPVNVISVQNMDSLLRLKLGPEAATQYNSSANEDGQQAGRRRRAVAVLCERTECLCEPTLGKWLNISCAFDSRETVELGIGSLPSNTFDLRLEDIGSLNIRPMAFGNTQALREIFIRNVNYIHVHSSAFHNISTASIYFEIEGCKEARFEDKSFKSLRGGVRPKFSDCEHIIFGHSVFSRLYKLHIINVPKLDLVEGTFTLEATGGNGPQIIFHNVTFDVIPSNAFSSSHEIGFRDCRIKRISRNSFGATEFARVFLENTDLNILESGAFSEGTLVHEMELRGVRIETIEPGVFTAVSKLSIQDCTIKEVLGGAIKVTTASFRLINNEFNSVRRHAFEIYQWNHVSIEGNVLHHLEVEAFYFPFSSISGVSQYTFSFSFNEVKHVEVGSLEFIPTATKVDVHVDGNRLGTPCSCNLQATAAGFVKSDDLANKVYVTSHCLITDWLADCFRLPEGYIPMVNYTEQICGPSKEIKCEQASHRYYPEENDLNWSIFLDHERRLVSFIILTALCGVCFILIIVLAMWIKRKGLVGRVLSLFFQSSSLVTTSSISRVNIHEYAEIQNLQNQTQIVEESDEDEIVPIDDKATQTLPEELTQDLLQSLREKLDDPENYREARDMIEHLYDLIKVEESCNNRVSTFLDDGNLYAEVRPRTHPRPRNREVASVGTRSPSLDKLDPVHYLPRPVVSNEYAEPRDRHVPTHLYCELPGGVPDVVVPSSSSLLANRPLPETPGMSHL